MLIYIRVRSRGECGLWSADVHLRFQWYENVEHLTFTVQVLSKTNNSKFLLDNID